MTDDFEEEQYYLRDAIEGSAKLRDAVNRLRLCNAPIVWFEPAGVSPMFRRAKPPKQRRFHKSRPKTKYCIPPLVAHETPAHHPRIEQIKEWVASHFEIHPVWMAHPDRHWSVSHPRQIAMYLARKMTEASFPTIGRHFNRDHTTVMFAVRAVKADQSLHKIAQRISAEIDKSGDNFLRKSQISDIEQDVNSQDERAAA